MRRTSAPDAGVRYVSVQAGDAFLDVTLSALLPLEAVVPAIVDLLGVEPGPDPVGFEVRTSTGLRLDAGKTLQQLGIDDGSVLVLIRSSSTYVGPRCDDVAEAVSAAVEVVEQCWTRNAVQRVSACAAVFLAGVGAGVLTWAAFEGASRVGCAGFAVVIGLLAASAATAAPRAMDARAAGLTAVGFTAVGGLIAVPDGPAAPNALLATVAAAICAIALAVLGCEVTVFATIAVFAAACAVASGAAVLTGAPAQAVGAALAALSLAMIEASPTAAMLITGLSPQRSHVGPGDGAERLTSKVSAADNWIAVLLSAFSASAAVGATGALCRPSPQSLAFAAVTAFLLLARSQAHRAVKRALPLLICGLVTLGATVVAVAITYTPYAVHVAVIATALGLGAWYLTASTTMTTSLVWRRGIQLIECLGFAAVIPLTFSLCGVFSAARGANLS